MTMDSFHLVLVGKRGIMKANQENKDKYHYWFQKINKQKIVLLWSR